MPTESGLNLVPTVSQREVSPTVGSMPTTSLQLAGLIILPLVSIPVVAHARPIEAPRALADKLPLSSWF